MGRVFVNGEEQEEAGQSEDSGAGQHLREVIAGERDAIAAYLRRVAVGKERLAHAALADTMQSKPEADRLCAEATDIRQCAVEIQEGRHWR